MVKTDVIATAWPQEIPLSIDNKIGNCVRINKK